MTSPEETAVVFVGGDSAPFGWLRLADGVVVARGTELEALRPGPETTIVLAVPGERVTLHWIELPESLSPRQTAAAARLQLAASTLDGIDSLHVAPGYPEGERRCVAVTRTMDMSSWLSSLEAHALTADRVIPQPLLLRPRDEKLVRFDLGGLALVRGEDQAFGLEPALASLVVGDAPIEQLGADSFESDIQCAIANAPVDLLQGEFARKRRWRTEPAKVRRLALLALAFVVATLALQVALLMRQGHSAGQMERETERIVGEQRKSPGRLSELHQRRQREAGFTALSAALFGALQTAPAASLAAVDYAPDRGLRAVVRADTPATAEAVAQAVERSGFRAHSGPPRAGAAGHEIELRIVRQ